MADTSSSLSLPFIQPSQAQKHVTHNEALRILDVLTQLSVVGDDQATPPGSPAEGVKYIVGDGGTNAWAGRDGEIALYETGNWRFFVPQAGWRAYVTGREALLVHDGTDWIDLDSDEVQEIEALGLGMIALENAPFSAKLNAALWTALYQADGGTGDLTQILNKESAANDAGLIFQQNFQTRGLFGLFGDDNLRLSTSADGSAFLDGLNINVATGIVDQPQLPRFKGTTDFDNYCAADTWTKISINAAEFNDQGAFDAASNLFTAPADGTYCFGGSLTFKQNVSLLARMSGRLIVNGTQEVSGTRGTVSGTHVSEETSLTIQTIEQLTSGDTVELQGQLQSFDGYFMAGRTAFWGYKVG